MNTQGLDLGSENLNWFDSQLDIVNTGFLNGQYYHFTRKIIGDHAYLSTDKWLKSDIIYRNQLYNNMEMMYNLEEDVVIFRSPNIQFLPDQIILPNQNNISEFWINNQHFKQKSLGFGRYYEVIREGNALELFVHRRKKLIASTSSYFEKINSALLIYQDDVIVFRGKTTLYSIFPEKKTEIRRFIRQNGLKVNEPSMFDLGLVIDFCNENGIAN